MPITPYLDGRTFDPGTERVTGDAFEMALAALRISNPSDHVAAIVARRILALAKNGESNADHLCDQGLASLGRVLRSQRRRHLPSATAKRLTAARAFWVGGPDEWFGIEALASATKRLMASCRSTTDWNNVLEFLCELRIPG
jgi:hypothetical protein